MTPCHAREVLWQSPQLLRHYGEVGASPSHHAATRPCLGPAVLGPASLRPSPPSRKCARRAQGLVSAQWEPGYHGAPAYDPGGVTWPNT